MLALGARLPLAIVVLCLGPVATIAADGVDLAAPLSVLRSAPTGAGSQAAQRTAWQQVAAADVSQLPAILDAMDQASPLAANWLRSAADAVAERRLQQSGALPQELLTRYALDTAHPPLGRRVAFQWLVRVEPEARQRMLAQMLDDPSLELRYDAVAELIEQAEAADDDQQRQQLYQQAFDAALDVGQIDAVAAALGDRGVTVNLVEKMGLVTDWQIIGPFDNVGLEGFAQAYPPETNVDYGAEHQGKTGLVAWKPFATSHPKGIVDLNEVVTDEKEVVAYAATVVHSDRRQPVDVRFATKNAVKLWVNDEPAAAFEVYHAGYATDQYRAQVVLEPGDNRLLLKVCQNEKEHSWQEEFDFQLRVTDRLGQPAPIRQQPVAP